MDDLILNLNPKLRFLTLAYLLTPNLRITPYLVAELRYDLGIPNGCFLSDPETEARILKAARQYQELCLGCLQPTGYGMSYEMQVGCKDCDGYDARVKLKTLEFTLQADPEGQSRRALMQWCYQCLEQEEI